MTMISNFLFNFINFCVIVLAVLAAKLVMPVFCPQHVLS